MFEYSSTRPILLVYSLFFPVYMYKCNKNYKKEPETMEHEREERAALIAAILPLLEKMPLVWLRATLITAEKRAARKE